MIEKLNALEASTVNIAFAGMNSRIDYLTRKGANQLKDKINEIIDWLNAYEAKRNFPVEGNKADDFIALTQFDFLKDGDEEVIEAVYPPKTEPKWKKGDKFWFVLMNITEFCVLSGDITEYQLTNIYAFPGYGKHWFKTRQEAEDALKKIKDLYD